MATEKTNCVSAESFENLCTVVGARLAAMGDGLGGVEIKTYSAEEIEALLAAGDEDDGGGE